MSADEEVVAWLIYIVRDTQKVRLQIGWDANEYYCQENEASPTFGLAKTVPFGIFFDVNDTLSDGMVSRRKHYNRMLRLPGTLIRYVLSNCNKSWALAVSLLDIRSECKHFVTDADKLALYAHGSLITLQINKRSGDFRCIYDINRITEEEINRIASRLLVLLTSMDNIHGWNQTAISLSPACCLRQLFETQVECACMMSILLLFEYLSSVRFCLRS